MIVQVIVAALTVLAAYVAYKIKTMRSIDRHSLVLKFMMKTGIFSLFGKLKRPTTKEITLSNGMKIIVPHPAFGGTIETILKMDVRQDDVFIATYPKAGTTWMQEIVWLICNNAETKAARKQSVSIRYGFLEVLDATADIGKGFQSLEKWPQNNQRMIRTHLPYQLLPEYVQGGGQCKVIYVARNPKDLCVSYYHFHRMNRGMPAPGSWSEFLTNFCCNKLGYGSWFDHTLTYWKKFQENKKQIYFVTYEDLKKNLREELVPLSRFLGKELSDEQLDTIASHCTFRSMSENKSTNYEHCQKYGLDFKTSKFMRKGEVGDWKNHFTINQNQAFDALFEEKMKGSELEVVFEIDT